MEIGIVTGRGCRFNNDDNLEAKSILIDIVTVTDPCRNPLFNHVDRSARRGDYATRKVASVKKNRYRGTFPSIFC